MPPVGRHAHDRDGRYRKGHAQEHERGGDLREEQEPEDRGSGGLPAGREDGRGPDLYAGDGRVVQDVRQKVATAAWNTRYARYDGPLET